MNNLKYFILLFAIFALPACDSYLDVNEDPNRATAIEADPLFVSVLNSYSTNRVIDLGPAVSTASQHWSGGGSLGAGVFTDPERYVFSIFTTGNTWRAYYREIQKNLALAIGLAQESEDPRTEAQCKIFSAFTFYSATMLWEDVPYTQAVDLDFFTRELRTLNPEFDPQETILRGLLVDLDEALALIEQAEFGGVGSGDLLYGGNMDQWTRFANSLKFRVLMTLVDRDPSLASEINSMVNAGNMISSNADNAEFPFFNSGGNQNPFWRTLDAFAGGSNFFFFAGERMVDLMKSKNDPRIAVYYRPFPGGGSPDEVTGAPAGVTNIGFNPWVLSTAPPGTAGTNELIRPNSPDVLFSYSEQALLEAEAHARGLADGGLSSADQKLRAGISAAMAWHGVSQDAIDEYLANEVPDLTTLSANEARRLIAEELWVDCIIRPLEGFTHWRRSGIPELNVPDGAITTGLFQRLPYPPDELAANSNAPAVVPTDQRMWFQN